MDDIETILNTLIYDGKVEMTVIAAKEGTVGSVDGQMKLYRGVNPVIQPTGLVRTPCGLCPVTTRATQGRRQPIRGLISHSLPPSGVRRLSRRRRDLSVQLHLHDRVAGFLTAARPPRHIFTLFPRSLCSSSFKLYLYQSLINEFDFVQFQVCFYLPT